MLEVDTHVHTVVSGHAHSTIYENVTFAKRVGLKGFASTDHGPHVHNTPKDFTLNIMKSWPDTMEGIRVYKSIEANIMDDRGNLDVDIHHMNTFEFVLAGIHEMDDMSAEERLSGCVAAYENPYLDCVTHPDKKKYIVEFEPVVLAAKRQNKLVELNNKSLHIRAGGRESVPKLVALCRKHDVRMIVSSDAHICYNVGNFALAEALLKEMNFPDELVLNKYQSVFDTYVLERAKRLELI